MKKKFFTPILLLILTGIGSTVIIVSCNKLDLTPLDKTTTATFYTKKADFDGGIFAAYSSMQDCWAINSGSFYGG